MRECLVRRHARDAFRLADKMPMWFVKERADVARLFDEQLQKTASPTLTTTCCTP